MTTPLRAAPYGRQSHKLEKSVHEQIEAGRADAARQGWEVTEVYSDLGSASRFGTESRDDWDRLQVDVAAGKLDVVVLWESSRGDRTPESWLAFLSVCRRGRVKIRVTKDGTTYNLAKARQWRTLAEDGIDNAYESERTSERVRRGVGGAARSGKVHGKGAWGYQHRYDPTSGKPLGLIVHPDNGPVVERIFRDLGDQVPVLALVRALTAEGVPAPTGGKWYTSTVRGIARNPAYVGKRVHRGERADEETDEVIKFREEWDADWPVLVDLPLWTKVQRILGDDRRKGTRPGKQKWLLSYLLTCGVCEEKLNYRPERTDVRGTTRRPYYACVNGCQRIMALDVEDYVTERLMAILSGLDLTSTAKDDDAEMVAAQAEVDRLKNELEEALESVGKPGGLSVKMLARVEERLEPLIDAAERKVKTLAERSVPAILRDAVDVEDIRSNFTAALMPARRDLIRQFLDITVLPGNVKGTRFGPGTPAEERVQITRKVPYRLSSPVSEVDAS
jgi:site-specific DNA recombinase